MMSTDLEGFNSENSNSLNVNRKKKESRKSGGFQSFGLSLPILKGLYKKGYRVPTPIQRKTIPLILQGRDVVGMARTGSGKTACFLLPLFEKLSKKASKSNFSIRALIFSPTRELALQTLKFIKELGKFTCLKAVTILGGDSMDYQFGAVHNNPDIIVATPGRFLHLCIEMNLKLHSIEYVVFDEADRLFEMGFGEQLKEILDRLGDARQTVLFSATLPKLLLDFASAGLNNPILLRLDVDSKLPKTLELAFLLVKQDEKLASLLCLLQSLPENSQTLVFVATKHYVEYLHMVLDKANISNTYIYSDLDASARKINAAKFLNKKCSVLIVTDIAARGVDIPHLDFVINYHFPSKSKLFVHRVGRCARAGRIGTAFSLVSLNETPYMLDLHLFLGKNLNLIKGDSIEEQFNCENAVGKIPTFLIENQQSELSIWHQNYVEIFSMQQVCLKSYKKYLSSRPGVSMECVKKIKEIDLTLIGIHPFFKNYCSDETKAVDFLQEMKKYRPKGTIFELNLSNKSKCYSVMKITKKKHEQHILNFKKKVEKKKDVVAGNPEIIKKEIKDENFNETDFKNAFSKGCKRKSKSDQNFKVKKSKFIDENFYIPHRASDEHTERGFAVNNFGNEANKVTFDLTADCDEGMKMNNQIKKWDKKRKKIVNVEHQKIGKFKTESGNWISRSYQSNRYAKWKERCKEVESDAGDENEEISENPSKTHFVKKNDFTNTKWGRRNRKAAEKLKAKAKLKRPEQILKNRLELEHKQRKSLPRILKKQWRKKRNNK